MDKKNINRSIRVLLNDTGYIYLLQIFITLVNVNLIL